MVIADQKVVSIHYKLTDDDGQVIQESTGGEPLSYVHGAGNIIPGLESALSGKAAGDKLNVSVEPEQGYGSRNEALIQELPRKVFEGIEDIQEGMQLQAHSEQGTQVITVARVDGDRITVDGNHPLAGQTLNFEVEVDDVRDATSEEVAHGHVHKQD
ncbi:MAG TPA: peptidylprolyl isomerase [Gammaproteobacteria bacterium]|nr:peptidylprolyl isomerase [Gammaproteobacteria bacterium]